uniref:SHD domain-containing protein n=1 Tax=Meloidogyne javanica TaxID=6303 RepID=A0A915N389_MELJA
MDVDELRRQQFAIKSFTESVEEDLDEDWQRRHSTTRGEVDSGMKESSTDETIIEVTRRVDPTKGETQKYTMRVSGPELVDQEFELHKSLVHSASGGDTRPRSSTTTEEYPAATSFAPRPRNSSPRPRLSLTPNTTLEIETTKLEPTNDSSANIEKIRVVLPPKCKNLKSSQRRYSTGPEELSCRSPTMTRLRCDSTAAAYHYHQPGEDIIESNPEYARKAPKKPVVHRRQSRGDDWENFPEEEQQPAQSLGDTEDESVATENLELAKQLQQQVHKLIDEVEQHRQQLEEEVEQQIMDSSDKPQPSNISNIQLPPLSDSSYENTFETPAHFASENFASAHQNNQTSNAPVRTVPTQMSEEIVESREEAHWSTKMEFASESNKATIKEVGNPFTQEETQASHSQYITDSSNLFYSNGGQQEYQQQSYTEGGYYYGNETTNTAATAEGYASNYQDYSYAPSTYETAGYYSTDYGTNNPYGAVPPTSSDIYQYNYNYDGQYAAVSDPTIEQQIPVAAPYSGLNPFSEDGNAVPYQSDLPPQTNETPVDTRTHDPFSWEAQESEIEQHGGASLPPRPPPRTSEDTVKQMEDETVKRVEPPARPKIPPPSRPPAPTAAKIPDNPPSNGSPSVVNKAVKNTGERLGQLGEQSAASQLQDDQQVQSYLSTVGGTAMQLTSLQRQQILEQEAHHKKMKAEKRQKKLEKLEKGFEEDMEKAATELAKKIAAQHGFKLGNEEEENESKVKEENEESDESEVEQHEAEKDEAETNPEAETKDEAEEKHEAETRDEAEEKHEVEAPPSKNWAAAFESASLLPPSESDVHLAEVLTSGITDPFDTSRAKNLALGGGGGEREVDPFAPLSRQDRQKSVIDDPFDVRPIEELIAEARQQAEMERARREAAGEYIEENEGGIRRPTSSRLSTPTQEGGSPVTPSMVRPVGFEDDFKNMAIDEQTPLYDEDDSLPLSEFPPRFTGDGWELLLRYPPKKKLMADRYWKPIFVRLNGNMLSLYANAQETRPSQEILLQVGKLVLFKSK